MKNTFIEKLHECDQHQKRLKSAKYCFEKFDFIKESKVPLLGQRKS